MDHAKYMAMAIQEAEDGVQNGFLPYGGIIVKNNQVIGKGKSTGVATKDPTAHAEMNAIRQAAQFLGCLLYTSPSPRDGLLSRMPSSA